jgi:hypothetical protein
MERRGFTDLAEHLAEEFGDYSGAAWDDATEAAHRLKQHREQTRKETPLERRQRYLKELAAEAQRRQEWAAFIARRKALAAKREADADKYAHLSPEERRKAMRAQWTRDKRANDKAFREAERKRDAKRKAAKRSDPVAYAKEKAANATYMRARRAAAKAAQSAKSL